MHQFEAAILVQILPSSQVQSAVVLPRCLDRAIEGANDESGPAGALVQRNLRGIISRSWRGLAVVDRAVPALQSNVIVRGLILKKQSPE